MFSTNTVAILLSLKPDHWMRNLDLNDIHGSMQDATSILQRDRITSTKERQAMAYVVQLLPSCKLWLFVNDER